MTEEISYEQLFDLLRREKTREDLQDIDKNFYINIIGFLNKKRESINVQEKQHSLVENLSLEKEKLEYKNMNKILNEIIDRRQKKIILLAYSRARIPSTIVNNDLFSVEEKKLFEESVLLFRNFKEELGNSVFAGNLDKSLENTKSSVEEPKKEKTLSSEQESTKSQKEVASTEGPSEKQKIKEDEEKKIKVKFLTDMPKFYGPKKEILGPFVKGETYEVSELIANILIKKQRAVKVE